MTSSSSRLEFDFVVRKACFQLDLLRGAVAALIRQNERPASLGFLSGRYDLGSKTEVEGISTSTREGRCASTQSWSEPLSWHNHLQVRVHPTRRPACASLDRARYFRVLMCSAIALAWSAFTPAIAF